MFRPYAARFVTTLGRWLLPWRVSRIDRNLETSSHVFPRNRHGVGLLEAAYALKSVLSGRMTSHSGANVDAFEQSFAAYHGTAHAVAVTSGTAALQVALSAIGVTEGDEVIVPAVTFASTAMTVLNQRAVPVFVDVSFDTGNIDVGSIERAITERTRAVIPVHLCGVPCKMDEINELARKHDVAVIEDAAQACGATYHGRLVGSMGQIGCFSFYESKNLATGEGGMVVTADDAYYHHMAIVSNIGKSTLDGQCERSGLLDETIQYAHLGWNYRMAEVQAAVGRAQLRKLGASLARRRRNVDVLRTALQTIEELEVPEVPQDVSPAYNALLVKVRSGCDWVDRDWLCMALRRLGIPVSRPYARSVDEHPIFQRAGVRQGPFENARRFLNASLVFDIGPYLRPGHMKRIGRAVGGVLSRNRRVKIIHFPSDPAPGDGAGRRLIPPGTFVAGSAKADITPRARVFLPHLECFSRGVSDPLCARALIMGNAPEDLVCFVQLDHLGMNYNNTLALRRQVARSAGIPVERVFILFSHTHSAPDLLGIWGGVGGDYFQCLRDGVITAVTTARNGIQESRARVAQARITDEVRNFYTSEADADDTLAVLRIEDTDSNVISTLINMGVHSPENGEFASRHKGYVSAEMPGCLCEHLDRLSGGVTVFANRMLGDSYPRMAHNGDPASKGARNVTGYSPKCVAYTHRIASHLEDLSWTPIENPVRVHVVIQSIELPCANKHLGEYFARGFSRPFRGTLVSTEIGDISIGDVQIRTVPGELFCDAGRELLSTMPGRHRFLFSACNDIIGYIIPPDRYVPGGTKERESLGPATWPLTKEGYHAP